MNFMERAKYRYTKETRTILSKTNRTSTFKKTDDISAQPESQEISSKEIPTVKKKKPKKRKPNRVEIAFTNETINPDVIFVTHHPGVTKVNLNPNNDQYEETVRKLKKKLSEF